MSDYYVDWYPCERCGGSGHVQDGDYTVICPDCDGYGFPDDMPEGEECSVCHDLGGGVAPCPMCDKV